MQKFTSKLSISNGHEEEAGRLFVLLAKGIKCVLDSAYQAPHWTHTPTPQQLEMEEECEIACEDAAKEAEEIARQIYLALTGEIVLGIRPLKWSASGRGPGCEAVDTIFGTLEIAHPDYGNTHLWHYRLYDGSGSYTSSQSQWQDKGECRKAAQNYYMGMLLPAMRQE